MGEVGRERGVWWVKVGEGGRREGWGRGDYFLFLKGGTQIFKNYTTSGPKYKTSLTFFREAKVAK